jgi:hypothetical protein
MRLPTTLAGLLYFLVSQAQYASAGPLVPKDELERGVDWIKHLFDRQIYCAGQYCGISSQYCCTGGSTCYTDSLDIAGCHAPTAANLDATQAGWEYYTTTTMVITSDVLVTIVSTISSFVGVAATTTQELIQSTAICSIAGQQECEAICCDYGSTCYAPGKCIASATAAPTTSPSAPLRQTPGTATTTTAIVSISISTTQTFVTPASTAAATSASGNGTAITEASTGGGLSGGAIAGIVIGVIAGIILLLAVCLCCILKTGFDAILGLFGLRDNRRKERVVEEEVRYSRHGSASSRRDEHVGWFGGGRGRSTRVKEKKKSGIGEGGILAAIALGLAGLWALLGLRRRRTEKRTTAASDVSYSYYSDSYSGTGTSESEFPSSRHSS